MSVAIHIEGDVEDIDKAKADARALAKSLDARRAFFSTSDGSWDLMAEEAVDAETTDGKKVRVKNPAAFSRPVPEKIEYRAFRVGADFAEEQGLKEGDWVAEDPKKQRRYIKATLAQVQATANDPTVHPDEREFARTAVRQMRQAGTRKGGRA